MNTDPPRQTNYVRRAVGVLLGVAPLLLCIASTAYGFTQGAASPWRGIELGLLALAVGMLNFFLSFVRPVIYQLSHRTRDGYRHVSGLPMVGTVLLVMAAIYGFGAAGTGAIGFCALLLDTGGVPWFICATWHDPTLWDA